MFLEVEDQVMASLKSKYLAARLALLVALAATASPALADDGAWEVAQSIIRLIAGTSKEDVATQTPPGAERITFPAADGELTAELFRPAGAGPFPAVVALHGCSGLYNREGTDLSARHRDWANRLVAAGYVVLFADSFSARGFNEICKIKDRPISPKDRAGDAMAAARWLLTQGFVDPSRVNLMGWSHGAMSVLWAVLPEPGTPSPLFASAVAFYPGCREIARQSDWRPVVPLTLLTGGSDDWTEPGPCRELSHNTSFRFIEYPGAYHDFDAPDTPVHTRRGLSAVRGGVAHVGTNLDARRAAIDVVINTFSNSRLEREPATPKP